MTKPDRRRRAALRASAVGGAVTATAVAFAAFAPTAEAGTVSVNYGNCNSSNTALAQPPPAYTAQVTLTPQGSGFTVGKAISITWHYGTSTAPAPGIPVANVASAKAKIVVGGAASSTISTGSSANFPPSAVPAGGTFQIPDMTATFTPTAAGTYTFTPGDNEQDIPGFNLVVTCKAGGASAAATITVAAAGGTGGSGGGGSTSTTHTTSTSHTTSGGSTSGGTTTGTTGGTSGDTSGSTTGDPASPSPSDSTTTGGALPHTGFNGLWLAGGTGVAAALGAAGLVATRRRRGTH